ncbi:MAG TPA: hypothetical protein VF331_09690 [Polyangiales bacterium]
MRDEHEPEPTFVTFALASGSYSAQARRQRTVRNEMLSRETGGFSIQPSSYWFAIDDSVLD